MDDDDASSGKASDFLRRLLHRDRDSVSDGLPNFEGLSNQAQIHLKLKKGRPTDKERKRRDETPPGR